MHFAAGMYNYLKSNNLRTITPEEASALATAGQAVIVDVRPREAYDKAHIQGSVSVPLFQVLELRSYLASSFIPTR